MTSHTGLCPQTLAKMQERGSTLAKMRKKGSTLVKRRERGDTLAKRGSTQLSCGGSNRVCILAIFSGETFVLECLTLGNSPSRTLDMSHFQDVSVSWQIQGLLAHKNPPPP